MLVDQADDTSLRIALVAIGALCASLLGAVLSRLGDIKGAGQRTHDKANEIQLEIQGFELEQARRDERIAGQVGKHEEQIRDLQSRYLDHDQRIRKCEEQP